jgi:hypothetical protein
MLRLSMNMTRCVVDCGSLTRLALARRPLPALMRGRGDDAPLSRRISERERGGGE